MDKQGNSVRSAPTCKDEGLGGGGGSGGGLGGGLGRREPSCLCAEEEEHEKGEDEERHVASMLPFQRIFGWLGPNFYYILEQLPCSPIYHREEPMGYMWDARPPPPPTLLVPLRWHVASHSNPDSFMNADATHQPYFPPGSTRWSFGDFCGDSLQE